ncbi:MAG: tetratricopeptide repeat protein, partial [SAR324 cluster bacterium]|nr:tetratricopeptide repeat protein [SAR324 cluster bacterium]
MKIKFISLTLLTFFALFLLSPAAFSTPAQTSKLTELEQKVVALEEKQNLEDLQSEIIVHDEWLKQLTKANDKNDHKLERVEDRVEHRIDQNNDQSNLYFIIISLSLAVLTIVLAAIAFFGFQNFKELKNLVEEAKITLKKIKEHKEEAKALSDEAEVSKNKAEASRKRTQEIEAEAKENSLKISLTLENQKANPEQKEHAEENVKILKEAPEEDRNTFDYWYALGINQFKTKKFPDAIISFEKALEFAPKSIEALMGRGYAHSEAGEDPLAIKDFNYIIEMGEKGIVNIQEEKELLSIVHGLRGIICAKNPDTYDEAL